MSGLTPKNLSFRLALALGLVCSLSSTLIWLFFNPFNIIFTIWIFGSSFGISYVLLLWGIKQFIDKKFSIIYKTIHSLKVGLKRDSHKVDLKEDVFGKIRKEVIEWDITNRAEIDRLQEQERFRREFIGNISHELKTPIFSIQGYILSLLEGGLEDKKINRNFLLKAEKGIDRMIEMVDDLDEIAKLESNRISLNKIRFNIIDLTKEVIESLEYKAKKKGLKLKISIPPKPIFVHADPGKISQILTNLIINSINYGQQDGKTVIRFFDLDENILVEIADDGKGIAEEHLPRLFERFYRVDKGRSRAEGGSGLGLAIVKHIIEAHQQTINVRSKLDEGSIFSFTLKKAYNTLFLSSKLNFEKY